MDPHMDTGGDDDPALGRVTTDDDPDLSAFFGGADMTEPLVPDGGKGLIIIDTEAD